MFRNVASDGSVFEDPDPTREDVLSAPGCILAAPRYTQTHPSQDYVYNWTRDAAVVAIELANGTLPANQPLIDYVQFAQTCQDSGTAAGHFDRAPFLINGTFRDGWTDQTDGPALQTLAILTLYDQLDDPTKAVADAVIGANLNFLENAYQGKTVNLWEEEYGYSFFARAVQLKCFQEITANTLGIPVPGWLANAIPWLETALQDHWNANGGYYQSLIPAPGDKAPYDPNSDIVMAAIYGAVAVTDTRLLATAALLRNQWNLASSQYYYPVNGADHQRGIGPMMGRYPQTSTTATTIRQESTTPGPSARATSPSCTTGSRRRSPPPTPSRSTPTRPSSSTRSASRHRARRPLLQPSCRPPTTRCCRRSSSTATTSSSASNSTPTPVMRRA